MSNYTIQADFFATGTKAGKPVADLPNVGLIAQRYALELQGFESAADPVLDAPIGTAVRQDDAVRMGAQDLVHGQVPE